MPSNRNLTFDVGGMGIKIIHFENQKLIKEEYLEHVEFEKGGNVALKIILEKINNYILINNKIVNVGICFPGIVDVNEGKILTGSFIQQFENLNILNFFKENDLVEKIVIENDAKSAAYGEYMNNPNNVKNAYILTIGSAVGGAYIKDGKLLNCSKGLVGEVSKVYSNLEAIDDKVVAHVASTMQLQRIFAKCTNQKLEDVSGKLVMEEYAKKNQAAIDSVVAVTNAIARLIFNIHIITGVEAFYIGGGISSNKTFVKLLFNKLELYYDEQNLKDFIPKLDICKLRNKAGCFGMMYKLEG